ncbi:hypothetical protein Scep_014955 [Stephania cephalantha]|uniref:FAS1 domain-containing protein n=1 Tax=Stephania cephalantha TaxID=152367 RepID=A0AAP0J287_9MAGN
MAARLLLASLVFFSFVFPISSPILPPETLTDAAEILSDSGFVAMSLTLELISQTLTSSASSATVFAPSDEAFRESGQPSFSLLLYHISPIKLSVENLQSLPLGTKIPTLFKNHSLVVTSSAYGGGVSLNQVRINGSAIYDFGPLSVFAIDRFFDPDLEVGDVSPPPPLPLYPSPGAASDLVDCLGASYSYGADSVARALDPLKSRGYSVIASLLDLQLPVMRDRMKMTVFAPVDEDMKQHLGNLSEWSSNFHAHVVPCRLIWTDLVSLDNGVSLRTLLDGFSVRVTTTSGGVLVLNGVPIIFPDMYTSDSLVVHGLQLALTAKEDEKLASDSFSEASHNNHDESLLDYGEL